MLFVIDPALFDGAGAARQAWLAATLIALRASYEGRLVVRCGDPVVEVPRLAREVNACGVHVSTETEPGGADRDQRVRAALAEASIDWIETGSPYAVTPGRVRKQDGSAFQVFTPFSRAWRDHGWRGPAAEPPSLRLIDAPSDDQGWRRLEAATVQPGVPELPDAGEQAGLHRWAAFRDEELSAYQVNRDRFDLDATSRLSPYLKFGVVHPRTLLWDLRGDGSAGASRYVTELAWREFYADVLHHNPASEWDDLRPGLRHLSYDEDDGQVEAWRQGRTGYPVVDAGMRQLLAVGWMHNRARMITASFLCKDLHVWWPVGARHFLAHLIDGDPASNNHGWQWVAGTGTDAAPYYRVFNPTRQGRRFDPLGDYVRRWIPELRHIEGPDVHEPWTLLGGLSHGYPEPIVDHDRERAVALERLRSR